MQTTYSGLRARREAAGLAREKLAQMAACSTTTIRNCEAGMMCSDAMAAKLAGALNCDPHDLFGNRDGR